LVHWELRNVEVAEKHFTLIGLNQSDYHVESSGLARPIGSQQPYYLTLIHLDADVVHHGSTAVGLYKIAGMYSKRHGSKSKTWASLDSSIFSFNTPLTNESSIVALHHF